MCAHYIVKKVEWPTEFADWSVTQLPQHCVKYEDTTHEDPSGISEPQTDQAFMKRQIDVLHS